MDNIISDNIDKCFEKLRLEITNTLLSIRDNSVQQEAIRNKIYSLLVDLRGDTIKGNLKEAHSRFVRDVSSIIEGMTLPISTEKNIKRMCKNDMYKWLKAVSSLLNTDIETEV